MICETTAQKFAQDWIAAWNSRDLPRILAHYTGDFEMSSPYIVQFSGEAPGTLRGKANVAAPWKIALERIPDLHFRRREVLVGANSIAIFYDGALGQCAVEIFFL